MLNTRYLLFLFIVLIINTHAQQREKLVLSSGAFKILDNEKVLMGSLEMLVKKKDRLLNPKLGLMITSDNTIYSYFGFIVTQPILYGFGLSFSFAPGLYYNFKRDILGHVLEFNSGFEIIYTTSNEKEISLSFHHISNGGLAKFNPGAEFILISYTLPLRQ